MGGGGKAGGFGFLTAYFERSRNLIVYRLLTAVETFKTRGLVCLKSWVSNKDGVTILLAFAEVDGKWKL